MKSENVSEVNLKLVSRTHNWCHIIPHVGLKRVHMIPLYFQKSYWIWEHCLRIRWNEQERCTKTANWELRKRPWFAMHFTSRKNLNAYVTRKRYELQKIECEQECIPVGCVPAAYWPYAGVCFSGSVCSRVGWVSAPGGGGIPACTDADPPPVNRITDTSKNITLATTSLRPVIKLTKRQDYLVRYVRMHLPHLIRSYKSDEHIVPVFRCKTMVVSPDNATDIFGLFHVSMIAFNHILSCPECLFITPLSIFIAHINREIVG